MKTLFLVLLTVSLIVAPASAQLLGSKKVARYEGATAKTVWWGDTLICSASEDSTGTTFIKIEDFPWNGFAVQTKGDTAAAGSVCCDSVFTEIGYVYFAGDTMETWVRVDTMVTAVRVTEGYTSNPRAITQPTVKPYGFYVRHKANDASTCKEFAESKFLFW